MGKRGTKPLPDAIKLARGTYRPDRTGDPEAKPKPSAVVQLPPDESLGDLGRKVWLRESEKLGSIGVLTATDIGAFAMYCRAHDEIAKCDAELEKDGEYFTTEKGFVGQHPAVNQRFKWIEIKRRYEAEFGMTPSSRSSVTVNKPASSGVMKRNRA